jgi:[CysO sulfur-carrier protein]-S-L-cysteine hydrolase
MMRTIATASRSGSPRAPSPSLRISRALLDEVIAHAREEAPNECCGLIASRDGVAVSVRRVRNIHASPLKFEMDHMEQYHATTEIEDAGLELGAIYHSHTRSAPLPSQTDVNLAKWWPEPLWMIVGLEHDQPDVRAWKIVDGTVSEAALEVEDGARIDV